MLINCHYANCTAKYYAIHIENMTIDIVEIRPYKAVRFYIFNIAHWLKL